MLANASRERQSGDDRSEIGLVRADNCCSSAEAPEQAFCNSRTFLFAPVYM